jgi:uncharacterized RmlC-like cupin family protein
VTDNGATGPTASVTRISADELRETDRTPGMTRRQAFARDGIWSGTATTEAGAVTGWHHHGEHESTIYLVRGSLHMEFGAGGHESFDAVAGDFVHVPAFAVHRESNTDDEPSLLVVVRCGRGEPTVNVDGPAAG